MNYYVKKIENNTYNKYKYHYLDHINCVIDIRQNYWTFAVDLFSINNFNIPINSLSGDMQLPYQEIKNIVFNLATDQSYAKKSVVHNADYSHIYSGYFNVDISRNEFFKQDLSNAKINFDLDLYIDPEAAKAAGSDIAQDVLDDLKKETNEQHWDCGMYYSNTYKVEKAATINNIVSYSLTSGHECIATTKQLEFISDELTNKKEPFNNLVLIKSQTPFQILFGKVKFSYWIELDSKVKTLEKNLTIDKNLNNLIDIKLDDYTFFDYEKNEVVFDPIGSKGFFIPKYSQGNYELELHILQDNVLNKFIIKNCFNFVKHEGQPMIGITHKIINNLDGYKEVIFND